MLFVISGNLGSGKTLLLVVMAKLANLRNVKIVSNFNLVGIPFEKFSISKFFKAQYNNCIILLDELYNYVDSRRSMSDENLLFSYTLFQSRKKTIEIYTTVQLNSTIDMRFRNLTDFNIIASKIAEGYNYLVYNPKVLDVYNESYLPFQYAEQFYQMYDTNEVISQELNSIKFLSPDEKKVEIPKLSEQIMKEYRLSEEKKIKEGRAKKMRKITLSFIRVWLSNNEYRSDYAKDIQDYLHTIYF